MGVPHGRAPSLGMTADIWAGASKPIFHRSPYKFTTCTQKVCRRILRRLPE